MSLDSLRLHLEQKDDHTWVISFLGECNGLWPEHGLPVASLILCINNGMAVMHSGMVDSEFRRQGLSTRLIQMAESLAKEKGCRRIEGVVHRENKDAVKILEASGYSDVLLFEKRLDG